MWLYIFLVILILALGIILENKNRKLYSILVCIIFTLIIGLRHYSIGVDTPVYVSIFNRIVSSGLENYRTTWIETGFLYFYSIIGMISKDYSIMLLIISFLTNFAICKYIEKYSNNMCVSFMLIILTRIFFSEMNIIRQYLSVAVVLLAIPLIEKKKFIKFLLYILVASLFHKSSWALFFVYFLYNINISNKVKIITIIISLMIYNFYYSFFIKITSLFGGTYMYYVDNFIESNKLGSIITFIINLIILFVIEIIRSNKTIAEKIDKKDNFFYNCHFVLTFLSFLAIKMNILGRITIFFQVITTVALPNYINMLSNKKLVFILYIIILTCFFINMIVVLKYRPEWYNVLPYKFYWQN